MIAAILILSLFGGAGGSAPARATCEGPVKLVGAFSNRRATRDRSYGYLVELWRCGDDIVGLFSFAEGRQTDYETGTLDEVSFDPRTGMLSFSASDGAFHFAGSLGKDVMAGRLTRRLPPGTRGSPIGVSVVLQSSKDAAAVLRDYPSYDEWKADNERFLKKGGPVSKR